MSHTITSQLVGHDLPGFSAVTAYQPPEETLSCSTITFGLEVDINNFAILINSPPEVMLFAVDLYEDFIDEEGITIPSVLPLESSSIQGAEFDTEPAP